MKACKRCNGTGRVAGFEHVHNGVCYACRGSGRRGPRPEPKRVTCTCDHCGATEVTTLGFAPACPVGWTLFTSLDGKRELSCGACRLAVAS